MTIYDKYSVNGAFNSNCLQTVLEDLEISPELINEVIIRASVNSLTKELIERLKSADEKDNILNMILEFFLMAETLKPETCNKQKLSELTGLSTRQIDERRRRREIPCIELTTGSGFKKKTYLYDPRKVMIVLKQHEVRTIGAY